MCVASGNCGFTAPRIFQNRPENGGFAELLQDEPGAEDQKAALEAEYLCPSGAIQIDNHQIPVQKWRNGTPRSEAQPVASTKQCVQRTANKALLIVDHKNLKPAHRCPY
ncbi:ferredoxin [Glutamicibacter mishrai]|uniref:ferredoxin n=1 Tax=Glutamicibacter mishrai TaxID=1775880 RepID=UPI0034C6599B